MDLRRISLAAAAAVVPVLAACRSGRDAAAPASAPAPNGSAWSAEFTPPAPLETARVRLEPLAPRHAELDYAALMSSREHLRSTLHWGEWPSADFQLEQNRADLARHWAEFETRRGYAYTVLAPDGSRCVGCVYMNPAPDGAMRLTYWVVEDQLAGELDEHLFRETLAWVGRSWPFRSVEAPVHPDNARGLRIARSLGLVERPAADRGRRVFVWTRAGA